MKSNTFFILTVIFIALSIWLSFTIKKANSELAQRNRQLLQSEDQNRMAQFRQEIMQEPFALNLANEPIALNHKIELPQGGQNPTAILYLKAHACSPCNMGVIKSIVKRYAEIEHFRIASHTSNRHFLMQELNEEQIDENKEVIWLNDKLYKEERALYDAELLFINPKGFILGVLPLELLKEADLFESVIAKIVNS